MTPVKGYTEMKGSGIPWIGEIPCHWDIRRNKTVFSCEKEIVGENSANIQLLSLTTNGIRKKSVDDTSGKVPESYDTYQYVHKDNLVLCLFDLDCSAVFSGLSKYEGMISPAYKVIKCNDNIVPGYADYWFRSVFDGRKFKYLAKNIRYSLTYEDFSALTLPHPPLSEQSAIAAYLDTQCAKIDEIIAQAKASIEDYKQWKASIIYEAVTKGLDPNVEMKESGIPCVDEIPKSWTVTRFGKIATVKSNLVNPKDYQSYKQISPENIEKGSGVLLDCGTVEESGVISGNHLFYKGQILYSKIRPTLNKVIIAPFDGLCSADMYPIDTDHCSRFILYLMLSAYFNEQVALVTGNRVKMPKINQNELSQIMVAIPSGTEEQQIAKYLDSSCSQIDVLIKEKQSLLDDLESYKKSLIYEIVTGKRSVQQ